MLKKFLSVISQAVAAARKQVSRRQLIVTAVSAAVMLTALIAFWNLFILPDRLAAPDSTAIIGSTERGGRVPGEDSQPGENTEASGKGTAAVKNPEDKEHRERENREEPDLSLAVNPVEGTLLKNYGFVFSPTYNDFRFHGGIDVEASEGDPVKCVLDGVVEAVATSEEEGCTVTLNHGGNWITVYSHLEAVQVEKGKAVPKGHVLGYLGRPGLSESFEGCHLHFEVLHGDERVNPLEFFDY
ncbi:MAG TPA: M23 family metallopeptidase [Clostridia bacterium]|jgi:murein DD-endopeptidase MepM/ murein hydrolase activator NlpD|nr:M23 family metallopeptidase [Clostridia bacterium]